MDYSSSESNLISSPDVPKIFTSRVAEPFNLGGSGSVEGGGGRKIILKYSITDNTHFYVSIFKIR